MLTTLQNKGLTMTAELRAKKEAEYEKLITAAMLEENLEEVRRLKSQRRAMRGGIFPPERIKADEITILDARKKREHPEVLFDPNAPEKPLYCGTARVVKTPSQQDRWKR
jgi:hypothetical protein